VFGARAGDAVATDRPWHAPAVEPARQLPTAVADDAPAFSRAALQRLLWDHAGLERDAAGLDRAASILAAWRAQHLALPIEDENLLLLATHVVDAARMRTTSVGAHFRTDTLVPAADAASLTSSPEALAC
jgi:L-aspartate oxidase